jgi:hypothetical protein
MAVRVWVESCLGWHRNVDARGNRIGINKIFHFGIIYGMLYTGGTQHVVVNFVLDVGDHCFCDMVHVAAKVIQAFGEACFHRREVVA